MIDWLFSQTPGSLRNREQCPVCGYYCSGKGGYGCIDKPALAAFEDAVIEESAPITKEQWDRLVKKGQTARD